MKPRNTALLALAVAALGAFVWLYEIRGAEKRAEAEAATKRVFSGLEASDISGFTLRTSDEKLAKLERSDAGWRLVEPLAFPADEPTAEGIASGLAQLESVAVFEEPAPLADYGLEVEPVLRFSVDGNERTLRIGDKTPIDGNTYVTTGEGERVYAVASFGVGALRKSLDDLRDKRIIEFDRGAVDQIRAAWPGSSVRLERREGSWQLLEPLETQADQDAVQDLLSDLSYLRAAGFIDAPPADPAEVGLDAPEFQVELRAPPSEEGGAPRVVSLAVGASREGDQRVVRGSLEGTLYTIPQERLDRFPRSVTAWRFRELSRFASGTAERFELVFHDEQQAQSAVISGERADSDWTTRPERMDPVKASELVSQLSKLTAKDIAAESMGAEELARLGLAPPQLAVRVYGKATEAGGTAPVLADIQLGIADPERGVAARRADRETVFWLDYSSAEDLPVTLEAFRNRFLATEPPAAETEPAPPGEAVEELPPTAPEEPAD